MAFGFPQAKDEEDRYLIVVVKEELNLACFHYDCIFSLALLFFVVQSVGRWGAVAEVAEETASKRSMDDNTFSQLQLYCCTIVSFPVVKNAKKERLPIFETAL